MNPDNTYKLKNIMPPKMPPKGRTGKSPLQKAMLEDMLGPLEEFRKKWEPIIERLTNRVKELEAEVERLKAKKCPHQLAEDWSKETTDEY